MTIRDQSETAYPAILETTRVIRSNTESEKGEHHGVADMGGEQGTSAIDGLSPGTALLIVKRGPNQGSRFLLDQPVTSVGRHLDSDIFLDDITISRRHAEFRFRNGQFEVVDVGSLNGTYVNRRPIDVATLAIGDEIQLGKFRLVFLSKPATAGGAIETIRS